MLVRGIVSILAAAGVCAAATCKNPEVRKEWRTLSKLEQLAWLASVKCLANSKASTTFVPSQHPTDIPPRNPKASFYDDIVYWHMEQNIWIHNTGLFLPFHRYMVHATTTAMREKCGYFGVAPYWDWTKDASDVYHTTMFDDNLLWGLGRWGDPKNDIELATGALSWGFPLEYPSPHRLRRNFTLQPYLGPPPGFWPEPKKLANTSFVPSEVKKLVNGFSGNFSAFQIYMEAKEGMHTSPHLIIGGDLGGRCNGGAPATCTPGPKWSVNDPLFFLHHGMIDKLWYDWQKKSSANAKAYYGGSVQNFDNNGDPPLLSKSSSIPTDGLFPKVTIGDMMDTKGSVLCYEYE